MLTNTDRGIRVKILHPFPLLFGKLGTIHSLLCSPEVPDQVYVLLKLDDKVDLSLPGPPEHASPIQFDYLAILHSFLTDLDPISSEAETQESETQEKENNASDAQAPTSTPTDNATRSDCQALSDSA